MPKLLSYYLGVDPGKHGGLALVCKEGAVLYAAMPPSPLDLWRFFRNLGVFGEIPFEIKAATLEFVSYFPGMGGVSAFTFGGNFHSLQVALAARAIPYEIIRPLKWMQELGIPSRGGSTSKARAEHKERLRRKAQQLFPKCSVWNNSLKIQRSVCDAILLAEYTRRKYENGG